MKYTPAGGGGITQLTSDVIAGPGSGSQVASLADVGTPGTVGDASHYPVITTDAKGRVTGAVATAIPAGVTPATTVVGPDAYAAPAVVGTSLLYAREDHDHGLPAAPASSSGIYQFTDQLISGSPTFSAVAYGGGVFVAIDNATGICVRSTDDGQTWASVTLPSVTTWQSIAFGNNTFVIEDGVTSSAYSTDLGLTWHPVTLPTETGGAWGQIAFGANTFIIAGHTTIAKSTNNGASWVQSALPATSTSWQSIAFGNNTFVIGDNNLYVCRSTNAGASWTVSASSVTDVAAIGYGDNTFVSVGQNAIYYSTDYGVTWVLATVDPLNYVYTGVAFLSGVWIAVGKEYGSTGIYASYSTDNGVNWPTIIMPDNLYWSGIAVSPTNFVAVGSSYVATTTPVGAIGSVQGANVTVLTPSSGSAFIASGTNRSTVYFQINAAADGNYSLTMGPITGAEFSIATTVKMVAGSDALVSLRVPAQWSVVMTLVTATFGTTTVVEE